MREVNRQCFCGRNLHTYQHSRKRRGLMCWDCANYYRSDGKVVNINSEGREVRVGTHEINLDEVRF